MRSRQADIRFAGGYRTNRSAWRAPMVELYPHVSRRGGFVCKNIRERTNGEWPAPLAQRQSLDMDCGRFLAAGAQCHSRRLFPPGHRRPRKTHPRNLGFKQQSQKSFKINLYIYDNSLI